MLSRSLALLVFATALVACGGKVLTGDVERLRLDEEPDAASGSDAATGGGQGNTQADAAEADAVVCPDVPLCNWCNGRQVIDEHSCVTGFRCANGVDPCVTEPCSSSEDCPDQTVCRPDGLCWPSEEVTCDPGACWGNSDERTCGCEWKCSDERVYGIECRKSAGQASCDCLVDGIAVNSCTYESHGPAVDCAPPDWCCNSPSP